MFVYLNSVYLGNLATRHSAHVGLCPLLILSTLDCSHFWFNLPCSLSTWHFFHFDSVNSEVRPNDEHLTSDCVKCWFYPMLVLSNLGSSYSFSAYLWVSSPGWMSTWNVSTWESGHMTFLPDRIVSSIGSVNSRLCSLLVLSTWESVHLRLYLLWFCPLDDLSTCHVAHVGLCPLLVLSALDSAHPWFCLLGSLSNWVFVYLNSVHLRSLATWHSAHVGLCPLLILSTLGSAHVWFRLLGSQST